VNQDHGRIVAIAHRHIADLGVLLIAHAVCLPDL
jgi:hypothetical protein